MIEGELEKALEEIKAISLLPENWGGLLRTPPSVKTIDNAVGIIRKMLETDIVAPEISANNIDSIIFHWVGPKSDLRLEIGPETFTIILTFPAEWWESGGELLNNPKLDWSKMGATVKQFVYDDFEYNEGN